MTSHCRCRDLIEPTLSYDSDLSDDSENAEVGLDALAAQVGPQWPQSAQGAPSASPHVVSVVSGVVENFDLTAQKPHCAWCARSPLRASVAHPPVAVPAAKSPSVSSCTARASRRRWSAMAVAAKTVATTRPTRNSSDPSRCRSSLAQWYGGPDGGVRSQRRKAKRRKFAFQPKACRHPVWCHVCVTTRNVPRSQLPRRCFSPTPRA